MYNILKINNNNERRFIKVRRQATRSDNRSERVRNETVICFPLTIFQSSGPAIRVNGQNHRMVAAVSTEIQLT